MPAPERAPELLVHHPALVAGKDALVVAANGGRAAHGEFLAALQVGASKAGVAPAKSTGSRPEGGDALDDRSRRRHSAHSVPAIAVPYSASVLRELKSPGLKLTLAAKVHEPGESGGRPSRRLSAVPRRRSPPAL